MRLYLHEPIVKLRKFVHSLKIGAVWLYNKHYHNFLFDHNSDFTNVKRVANSTVVKLVKESISNIIQLRMRRL